MKPAKFLSTAAALCGAIVISVTSALAAPTSNTSALLNPEAKAKQTAAAKAALDKAEIFYTGKPYDADAQEYIFAARNYDPQTARWTAADPSGFPDGANNQTYMPVPTGQLDPQGLTTINYCDGSSSNGSWLRINTITSPTRTNSDTGATMVIGWDIPLATNGWIVQTVSLQLNIYNADGSVNTSNSNSYYEAWRVTNGSVSGGDQFTISGIPANTYGNYTSTGWANYYPDSAITSSNPSTWGANISSANGLPSYSGNAPSWFSTSGAATHWMSISWVE